MSRLWSIASIYIYIYRRRRLRFPTHSSWRGWKLGENSMVSSFPARYCFCCSHSRSWSFQPLLPLHAILQTHRRETTDSVRRRCPSTRGWMISFHAWPWRRRYNNWMMKLLQSPDSACRSTIGGQRHCTVCPPGDMVSTSTPSPFQVLPASPKLYLPQHPSTNTYGIVSDR